MTRKPDIDFKKIAASALADAHSLLSRWLPEGRRDGAEYKSRNPTRADNKIGSFSINLNTGAWADFAESSADAAGGDLISLYAYLNNLSQVEAAKEVAHQVGIHIDSEALSFSPAQAKVGVKERSVSTKKTSEKKSNWVPILPVPRDAPPPHVAHPVRGKPSSRWMYRSADGDAVLGYVNRFETSDGGKETLPLTFCKNEETGKFDWRWISFPEPRPLYGLDKLAERPDAPVLLVEGEKCVDAAQQELLNFVVVSWAGGCKAVDKADFTPLARRKIVSWADCDSQHERLSKLDKEAGKTKDDMPLLPEEEQPGISAMRKIRAKVSALGCRWWDVQIPPPGTKPDGWDIADAIDDGLCGEELAQHIRENCVEFTLPEEQPESISTPTEAAASEDDERPWIPDLIYKKGELSACLSNVYQILSFSPVWRGVIAYDEFCLRVVKRIEPPYGGGVVGDWTDVDDSRTAMWLTRVWGFTPSSALVSEAVRTLAMSYVFHPVRDYLESLKWDRVPRLEMWAIDFLGAEDKQYTQLAGKWWLMGAVKRVLDPGCKFDYCLVLEGEQGKKKSGVFSILGGAWFGDTDLDFANKDSMIALAGKWIYELAELGALARSDERRQKSFLSRRFDEFRPPYGRTYIKSPRQLVFGGSTNEWEWNKDPTGGRRFWPMPCGEINIEALAGVRDQLFAEAYYRVMAGEVYWPTFEQQKEIFDPEQLRVEQPDGFVDVLHDWVDDQVMEFSLARAVIDGLKLDASKMTRDLQTRVGIALRKLGCERVERRNGMVRFMYKPPARNGVVSEKPNVLDGESGAEHEPF